MGRCVVAVLVVAFLAPVGGAHGAVVQLRADATPPTAGSLQITGLPGEANHVSVGLAPDGMLVVTDDASRLIPGEKCSGGGGEVRCMAPTMSLQLEITTSDGDDRIAVDGSLAYQSGYLSGGRGDDVVLGGSGPDLMYGDLGSDIVDGGAGRDELYGGSEADVLRGGPGRDQARYNDKAGPVSVTLDGSPDDGTTGEGDNVASDVENVLGGAGANRLVGSDGPNRLEVEGRGPNELVGGAGDDRLVARFGGVTMLIGGPGQDRLEPAEDSTVDVRDGEVDLVACNSGLARPLVADASDVLRGCVPQVALLGTTAPVTDRGRVRLRLRCAALEQPCRIQIELRLQRRQLARATLAVGSGRTEATVRLNRLGREAIQGQSEVQATVRVQAFRRRPPPSRGFAIETLITLRRR